MATPLEAVNESFLYDEVRRLGGRAFKWTPTVAGVPDRMVLFPMGRVYFVELKRQGEKPEPIQIVWHKRLRDMGFTVVVLDSRTAISAWLREVENS